MKHLILFAIFLPITGHAVAPFLKNESGGLCFYGDGQVLKKSGITCPRRLNYHLPEPNFGFSDEYLRQRDEFSRLRMEFGERRALGMKQSLDGIIPKILNNITNQNNKNKMKKVLKEYPDAFEILSEKDFLNWIVTDNELLDLYSKAKNTKNPSPIALEMLVIGYELKKITVHPRASEWKRELGDKQKQNFKKALKKYAKGHFSDIKIWLSKWNSFLEKEPNITKSKNSFSKNLFTNTSTSNMKNEKSFKFKISELDYDSLSADLKPLVSQANAGNLRAQYNLGLSFAKGDGASKNSTLGINLLESSANKNHIKSQYALGTLFEKEANYAKAFRWYGRAANLGHLESQFRIGFFYWSGKEKGVTKDFEKAQHWLEKAAKSGHSRAQFLLGSIYYQIGIPLDGYIWITVSEKNGLAGKYLNNSEIVKSEIAQELTEIQIENSMIAALKCIDSNFQNCGY
jgi:TPR repeat protein